MNERILAIWADEYARTERVLDAFEARAGSFRPHERSSSTTAIVWTLAMSLEAMRTMVLGGSSEFSPAPRAVPQSLADARSELARQYGLFTAALSATGPAGLSDTISVNAGDVGMLDVPREAMLQMLLHDHIHHRGQLSVYVRLTGGKVPSIYGPSADSPPVA